eukprot:762197-Pleurochrysis_carterae.AAC.2
MSSSSSPRVVRQRIRAPQRHPLLPELCYSYYFVSACIITRSCYHTILEYNGPARRGAWPDCAVCGTPAS